MKLAIISDIHEDIVSLKKALKIIELEKCDHIICLGDILGYPFLRAKYEETKNASECISLIKKYCSIVLLGNHDLFHVKKFPEHCFGFKFPSNWYELTAEEKKKAAHDKVWNYSDDYPIQLSDKEIEFFNSCPEYVVKEFNNNKVLFSHFVYPNFTGYVSTYHGDGKKLQEHFKYLNQNKCQLSICGHLHIEGLGISYNPEENFISNFLKGFLYYSYGEKKLKSKCSSVTIPALADNGQVNGFAIFDSTDLVIKSLSLNTNRRFIL